MFKSKVLWAVVVGGAMVAGCKDETKQPPSVPAAPTANPSGTVAPTISPLPTTRPSVPDVTVPALPVPATTPATPAAGTGTGTGTGASGDTAAADTQAQATVDQVKANIKDKKWDEADAALTKLEGMKDKLSPDMQKQVENLKTAVDAGKNLKLPAGLPSVPGTENK